MATILAWLCDPAASAVAGRGPTGEAHLRFLFVRQDPNGLMVELAEGEPAPVSALLRLEGRGLFVVATVLRRDDNGDMRIYIRLRAAPPLGAA